MEVFYPVDRAMGELNPNLPLTDIQELNSQMGCNLYASDFESESWFDFEPISEMIRIIDTPEFLEEI